MMNHLAVSYLDKLQLELESKNPDLDKVRELFYLLNQQLQGISYGEEEREW